MKQRKNDEIFHLTNIEKNYIINFNILAVFQNKDENSFEINTKRTNLIHMLQEVGFYYGFVL